MKVAHHRKQSLYDHYYSNLDLHAEKVAYARCLDQKVGSHIKKGSHILDIACGEGSITSEIGRLHKAVVHGMDINQSAVTQSSQRGVHVKKYDIETPWPYKDSSMDVVLSIQTIEHVINTDFQIQEAWRVLKKGGLFIISTPNLASWYNRAVLLLGYQPFFTEVSVKDKTLGFSIGKRFLKDTEPVGHIRVFTLPALIDICHIYKFSIVEVKGGSVSYLPRPMRVFDRAAERFPSLASDLLLVAKK